MEQYLFPNRLQHSISSKSKIPFNINISHNLNHKLAFQQNATPMGRAFNDSSSVATNHRMNPIEHISQITPPAVPQYEIDLTRESPNVYLNLDEIDSPPEIPQVAPKPETASGEVKSVEPNQIDKSTMVDLPLNLSMTTKSKYLSAEEIKSDIIELYQIMQAYPILNLKGILFQNPQRKSSRVRKRNKRYRNYDESEDDKTEVTNPSDLVADEEQSSFSENKASEALEPPEESPEKAKSGGSHIPESIGKEDKKSGTKVKEKPVKKTKKKRKGRITKKPAPELPVEANKRFKVGDRVVIVKALKKTETYLGCDGVVIETPVYPSTWFSVQMDDGFLLKTRSRSLNPAASLKTKDASSSDEKEDGNQEKEESKDESKEENADEELEGKKLRRSRRKTKFAFKSEKKNSSNVGRAIKAKGRRRGSYKKRGSRRK